jgi:hypothetical protein
VLVFGENCLFQEVLDRFGIKNAWRGEAAFWGSVSVGIDRLAAFNEADVICFDHGNEREMAQLLATPLWQAMPFVRAGASSAFRRCGSMARRCRRCILPACWPMPRESGMNTRISPLAIILLAGLLVAAFALSIVNLNVALPYAQWRQALWQPDIDNIAQMLFHYSLLPRLAFRCWWAPGWDWSACCSSRCCVIRWRSQPPLASPPARSWG